MSLTGIQNSYLYQEQQRQMLAKQMEKYQNGIAEYNLEKVVKYYTQAINSAENANDAKYLAEALDGLLSKYGKSASDIKGINNPLLTDPTAAQATGKKKKGDPRDRAVVKSINEEFGMSKSHKDKDWLELAKKDDRVRILDKEGNDVTNKLDAGNMKKTKHGDPKLSGYVLEVESKQFGKVKIAVGGDGNINGGDDKVISMGGQTAANGIFQGLNNINNVPGQAGNANPLLGGALTGLDPTAETQNGNQSIFTQEEIKHLLAAILQNALMSAEQKEKEQMKLQAA
jgi:hypothetical protein